MVEDAPPHNSPSYPWSSDEADEKLEQKEDDNNGRRSKPPTRSAVGDGSRGDLSELSQSDSEEDSNEHYTNLIKINKS